MKGAIYDFKKAWYGRYPTNPEQENSWIFEIEFYNDRYLQHVPLTRARTEYLKVCFLYAMENNLLTTWPQVWGWAANYDICPLPIDRDFQEVA